MTARRAALVLAIALASGVGTSGPAAGQGALRSQTNRVTNAIRNQIRQAVKPLLAVRNSAGEVEALALSPDGRYLAIVLHDNTARLWDLRAGQEQLRVSSPSGHFRAVRVAA